MSESVSFPATESRVGPLSFSLEVRGGRTGFSRRPILGDRFLIGSDPICDLRLDGRLAAPLHCLLHREGDRLDVERLTGEPIAVNGAPVEPAALADGDMLAVGSVRRVVHSHLIRFDVVRPADELETPRFETASAEAASRHAGERSAGELSDLIEEEEERVSDFEARQRAGASALLHAVRRTKRPASSAAEELAASADASVSKLGGIIAALAGGAPLRGTSEDAIREAAAELLAARRELLGEAERLLKLARIVAEAARPARQAA